MKGLFYYIEYYLLNRKMRYLLLSVIPLRKKLALARALVNLRLGRKAFSPPVYYQVEVTTYCNLKCPHCPRFHVPIEVKNMPLDRFKKIVDENPSLALVLLQGLGEPLVHPGLFDMIRHARSRGVAVMTCTNGTMLTEDNIQGLLDSGLNYLAISIDDIGPELEKVRPPTAFDKLRENLLRLRDMKEGTNLITAVWVTIQTENAGTFQRVIDLAAEIKADQMNFQHMGFSFSPGLESKCLLNDRDRIDLLNREVKEKCGKLGIRCNFLSSSQNTIRKKCIWPWLGGYVDVHGRLMPCCAMFEAHQAMGNLFEKPLSELWNNPGYQNFRACLTSPKVPAVCAHCHNL